MKQSDIILLVDFVHPAASFALESISLFLERVIGPKLAEKFHALVEQMIEAEYYECLGQYLEVTSQSFPELYEANLMCSHRFDRDAVRVFLTPDRDARIRSISCKQGSEIILVSSGVFEIHKASDYAFILGREYGHIIASTFEKRFLAHNPKLLTWIFSVLPGIGSVVGSMVAMKLAYDARVLEFVADRAGMLSSQNSSLAIDALCRSGAGLAGSSLRKLDTSVMVSQGIQFREYIKQAQTSKKRRAGLLVNTLGQGYLASSMPWAAVRALELSDWSQTEHYNSLICGQRGDDTETPTNTYNILGDDMPTDLFEDIDVVSEVVVDKVKEMASNVLDRFGAWHKS